MPLSRVVSRRVGVINLGGVDLEVRVASGMGDAKGIYVPRTFTIYLADDLSSTARKIALAHEVAHAIDDLGELGLNHSGIGFLANALVNLNCTLQEF